jgi:hypothetical protein
MPDALARLRSLRPTQNPRAAFAARARAARSRAARSPVEPLESRTLFAVTTIFSDSFEGTFLSGWTNRTAGGANASTKWGLNSTRFAAGKQSAFASAVAGGVTNISGYKNNQDNTLVRENVSLAGMKVATLAFDYFLNTESGYDTFSVAVADAAGVRTTVFSESGNFASAGWRHKSLDLTPFAGKSDLDIEFRFNSDASVINEGGGVWVDEAKLTGDTTITPGSISGRLFDDANNNKVRDSGEGALANWRVYLDQNRNGVRDTGEASKLTDANGNYSFTDLAPGTYFVEEELASGFVQTSPGPSGATVGSAFKIEVTFPDNSLTIAQRAAFTDAANRWAQIVVGDVPDVSDGGTVIDDLRITATAPSIDGRGGVLGQAAPTGFRANSTLPFKGFMEFDAADLAQLESDGQLTRVILHEMAHVLGFGTVWETKALTAGTGGGSDPRFLGPGATTQFNSIFATSGTSVPLEGGGNAGTADSHWRESVLGNEIMTGYLNGGSNPISKITVGSLADLGYTVSYSAADAYSKPTSISSIAAAPSTAYPITGPFIKAPRGVDFYGEMREEPVAVHVAEANTASATGSGSSEQTTMAFAHTVFVDTGVSRTGIDFGNRRSSSPTPTPTTNKAPVVTGVNDSPSPIVAGGTVTLTASGVSDPDGSVASVAFYRESNGTAGLQSGAGGDTPVGTDSTGADGYKASVSTAGLAAAVYTYYAQATDNAGAVSAVVSCVNTVTAAQSSSAPGTIAGTIFNDTNGNGVKDSGEPGLSGFRVYIDANKNGAFDASEKNVVTGSSGAYSFGGLGAGTYNVRQVDQSGWSRTVSSPVVTLTSGASASGKNIGNFKLASIAGRVFNDADRDGVQDTAESGLSGVRVYDDKNNNGRYDSGERNTTTNSAGDYTLGSLPAGARNVRIVLPSGRVLTTPSSGSFKLTPTSGQVITGKRFGSRTGAAALQLVSADILNG